MAICVRIYSEGMLGLQLAGASEMLGGRCRAGRGYELEVGDICHVKFTANSILSWLNHVKIMLNE